MVKPLGEEIIHYPAGFYHTCVKGQKLVSCDQPGKSNTAVIWMEIPTTKLPGADVLTAS